MVAHFVLVHGACGGAWSWFKIVDLLQKSGHKVSAVDLAGCGINTKSPQEIVSLDDYEQPLMDLIQSLPDDEKVVIVGHSRGGLTVAHICELFPHKIAVAVYLASVMKPADLANVKVSFGDLESVYGDDNNKPVAMRFNQDFLRKMLFSLSPSEGFVLAKMLSRPFPMGAAACNFSVTNERYGCVPRVYIKTLKDKLLLPEEQEELIASDPPERVFSIEADHSPAFSAAGELHKLILEVAKLYA